MSLENKSRYLVKLLRHDPENLVINKDGFVSVSDVLEKLNITKDDLDWIVSTNNKKRFGYNQDETMIRASQGHSKTMNIDIKMKLAEPTDFLYHGTARSNIESIKKSGLIPGSRKHVHLSNDLETARRVGLRHSKDIVILKVNSAHMRADNIKIYISDNNVYLTDSVDPKYIIYDK